MKYTLAFACSQDGFIAKHSKDNPFEWTSKEDQNHLQTLISENKWQVMGRTTHELNPNQQRKRIVFSRKHEEIKLIKEDIPDQFYFNPDLHQWSTLKCVPHKATLSPHGQCDKITFRSSAIPIVVGIIYYLCQFF